MKRISPVSKYRYALAVFSVLILLIVFIYTAYSWEPVLIVEDKPLNDLIKAGIQLKVEQSRSEFQLALLTLGALWALIIAKKDEAKILLSDWPELVMFTCANALLIASCWYHVYYVENITYVYSLAGGIKDATSIPDVFSSGINNPYRFQWWTLIGGMGLSALTLFSAHKLKRSM